MLQCPHRRRLCQRMEQLEVTSMGRNLNLNHCGGYLQIRTSPICPSVFPYDGLLSFSPLPHLCDSKCVSFSINLSVYLSLYQLDRYLSIWLFPLLTVPLVPLNSPHLPLLYLFSGPRSLYPFLILLNVIYFFF